MMFQLREREGEMQAQVIAAVETTRRCEEYARAEGARARSEVMRRETAAHDVSARAAAEFTEREKALEARMKAQAASLAAEEQRHKDQARAFHAYSVKERQRIQAEAEDMVKRKALQESVLSKHEQVVIHRSKQFADENVARAKSAIQGIERKMAELKLVKDAAEAAVAEKNAAEAAVLARPETRVEFSGGAELAPVAPQEVVGHRFRATR